tara:strand:+ start:154 stop:654 length:501 start_codon:yes stop_codon:yes gene_type:complete
MAEYTIQGIQERRREADSINRMLARAQRDPRLRRFFTPSMLSEAMNELNTYTAGYNAQVKAQEDAIRAQQEAEKQRIAEEQRRIQEQIEAEEQKVQQKQEEDKREEEFGVRDPADVPGVQENRRRQAAVDKASSMAVRMTSRGTRGRRGTSTSARRGRGFFDRYFA